MFLGPAASPADLSAETVRAYRDQLEHAGRTPATVAKHLSALRQLAAAIDADPAIHTVRSQNVARGEPRALSQDEFTRLLRMPDRRSGRGKCDLALLHLLDSVALRRAGAANLMLVDVDERRGAADPRLRAVIADSTSWWLTVRYGKRERTRQIPLDHDTLAALTTWVKVRPVASSEHLLLSLPRTGQPPRPLEHARYREDRRPPRARRRAARRPSHPARAAPHLLHPPRRQRRRHHRHPRARWPRRPSHDHDLHGRQP